VHFKRSGCSLVKWHYHWVECYREEKQLIDNQHNNDDALELPQEDLELLLTKQIIFTFLIHYIYMQSVNCS